MRIENGQARIALDANETPEGADVVGRKEPLADESMGADSRLEAVLHAARMGHWRWDLRTGVVVYDSRCAEILGYRDGEVAPLFDAWSDHIHPDDLARCRLAVARHLAGESDRYELEYRARHQDGRWIWIRSHGAVVQRDCGGTPLRVVGIHQEVTAQKEVEEMLRQRERLDSLGELTGGIAHNFNNSLAIMLATFEQLERLATDEATRRLARIGIQAAETAGGQVASLLTIARRQPVESTLEDLRACLVEAAGLLRVSLPGRVQLSEDPGGVPLPSRVHRAQFESAIVNLVVNARDAAERKVHVTLRARVSGPPLGLPPEAANGRFVRIDVEDDAGGMEGHVLSRAFDPFYTTKAASGGTGLGLSTVYAFCRAAGGSVSIDSTPGIGTTVTMYLPLAEETLVPVAAPLPVEALPTKVRARILVVEDNALLLDLACAILSEGGYGVARAASFVEAASLLQQGDFDLVLSDVSLAGGESGCDIVRWTRVNSPRTVVVLMSGLWRPQDADLAAVPFVAKPFRSAELLETVSRSLDPGK